MISRSFFLALLLVLLAGADPVFAQAASAPEFGEGGAALSWGADHVGAWLLGIGLFIAFALGFLSGKQR